MSDISHRLVMLKPMQLGASGYARMQCGAGRTQWQLHARGLNVKGIRAFLYSGGGEAMQLGTATVNPRGEAFVEADTECARVAPERLQALLVLSDGNKPIPLLIGLCVQQSAGSLLDAKNASLALCEKLAMATKRTQEAQRAEQRADEAAGENPRKADHRAAPERAPGRVPMYAPPLDGTRVGTHAETQAEVANHMGDEVPNHTGNELPNRPYSQAPGYTPQGASVSDYTSQRASAPNGTREGTQAGLANHTGSDVPSHAGSEAPDHAPQGASASDYTSRRASSPNGMREGTQAGAANHMGSDVPNHMGGEVPNHTGNELPDRPYSQAPRYAPQVASSPNGSQTGSQTGTHAETQAGLANHAHTESSIHPLPPAQNDPPREIFLPAIDPLPYVTAAELKATEPFQPPLPAHPKAPPVLRLHPLKWPGAYRRLQMYFDTEMPRALFDLPGWRFVNVSKQPNELWIGRYQIDGHVRRVAYALCANEPPNDGRPYRARRALNGKTYQVLWQRL